MQNFFDEYIYFDEKYNQIITTAENKIAALGIDSKKIEINGKEQIIKSPTIETTDAYLIPISELQEVYNISVEYVSETNKVVIESLDREQKN